MLAVLYNNNLNAYQSLSQEHQTLDDEYKNTLRDKNYYKVYYDKYMDQRKSNSDGNALESLYEYSDTHPLIE